MRISYVNTLEVPNLNIGYHELLDNLREQAVLCDSGGFDTFWLAEHHFGANGRDNSPNPFMLATDLGSRTKTIKMGTAVVILPLWHPLRVAENIALLDQMLKGRVEIGFGRASQPHEVVTFNPTADPRNPEASRAIFSEGLEVVRKALTEHFFSHSGQYYELPPKGMAWSSREGFEDDSRWIKDGEITKLCIVPKCYQDPHPPFSMAISTEGSATVAGILGLKPIAWRQTAKKLRDWVELYGKARRKSGNHCTRPGDDWGILRQVFIAPTMEQARKIYEPYFTEMIRYRAADPWRAMQAFLDPEEEITPDMSLDWDFLWNRCLIAGSPENVIEQIQELHETSGVGTLVASVMHEGLPQKHVLNCLELMSERVIPQVSKLGVRNHEKAAATGA